MATSPRTRRPAPTPAEAALPTIDAAAAPAPAPVAGSAPPAQAGKAGKLAKAGKASKASKASKATEPEALAQASKAPKAPKASKPGKPGKPAAPAAKVAQPAAQPADQPAQAPTAKPAKAPARPKAATPPKAAAPPEVAGAAAGPAAGPAPTPVPPAAVAAKDKAAASAATPAVRPARARKLPPAARTRTESAAPAITDPAVPTLIKAAVPTATEPAVPPAVAETVVERVAAATDLPPPAAATPTRSKRSQQRLAARKRAAQARSAAPGSAAAAPMPRAVAPVVAPPDDTVQAVLAVLAAAPAAAPRPAADLARATVSPAAPVAATPAAPVTTTLAAPVTTTLAAPAPHALPPRSPAPARAPATPSAKAPAQAPAAAPAPTGPAHSQIVLQGDDHRQVVWLPGQACPPALRQAAQQRIDDAGHLAPDDDAALPLLLRLAAEAHHPLRVDEAVWAHLAAHRDARSRLHTLEAAYPDGPASAALRGLLQVPLPVYQAEGALFAVVAGRALIADERGLGKGVQAIAASRLWQRHFGVQRVLVLCAPAQRAVWRRAWQRFAGTDPASGAPQVMDGGLHQRQALWSTTAGVRILSPEALASDVAHIAHWAPDLVIVDEPQQLALRDDAWAALNAPHALVLCGAALAEQPALMRAIVGWLDTQRLGPLAALHELQAASDAGRGLADADIERLTASLSRLMLQRLRADLADQLPPLVHTERLVVMAPGQRQAHDHALALARRLLDGWLHSGYLSDSDQWRLGVALRDMQTAAHRADPADPHSALAGATVQALVTQLDEWAATGAPRVAVLCASEGDRAQLAQRLGARAATAPADVAAPAANDDKDEGGAEAPAVQLLAPGEPLPADVDAVMQVGVPWRPRRGPAGPRDGVVPGQQWVYLVAQDSLDAGLFNTLTTRIDAPRGLADGGGRSYLQGERLTGWLQAVQAAVVATVASRRD